ncbi:ABC transporter substrate-binding protein [Ottowia sp. VDI28]|uniref:ABC transporter substrate-binding protein n=1 Tax=Ottowia sp. VDI28 TaxID=3133968 RepID=UPI003C2C9FEF
MTFVSPAFTRRSLLRGGAASAASLLAAPAVLAQSSKARNDPPTVLQIVDTAPSQQDVAKDFFIGSLAAWQDWSARGGARGRTVAHRKLEVNTTTADGRTALAELRDNPSIVAVSGTVSEAAARQLRQYMVSEKLALAHAAPWLQDIEQGDDHTFPIFANRQAQLVYALKSQSLVGVREIGAVYASARDRDLYQEGVSRVAATLQLKLVELTGTGDPRELGRRVSAQAPAVMLFLGGTPELARFTQGLADQARQRYVIALADVNLQILRQMGASLRIPVIAAQVVPLARSSLPVVMSYRATLARLFDEPTSSLSLAGYLAARYTQQVLAGIQGSIDRASVLAAFQQRQAMDLGGFRVAYDARGSYVTQSMLTADGREIG